MFSPQSSPFGGGWMSSLWRHFYHFKTRWLTQIVKYTWSSNSLPWFPQSWTPSHRFSHQRFCMWRVCGWTRWPWGGMEVKDKVRDAYQVITFPGVEWKVEYKLKLKWKIRTRNVIDHIIFQYCFTSKFDLQGYPIVRQRNSCWQRWNIQIFFCIWSFLSLTSRITTCSEAFYALSTRHVGPLMNCLCLRMNEWMNECRYKHQKENLF